MSVDASYTTSSKENEENRDNNTNTNIVTRLVLPEFVNGNSGGILFSWHNSKLHTHRAPIKIRHGVVGA